MGYVYVGWWTLVKKLRWKELAWPIVARVIFTYNVNSDFTALLQIKQFSPTPLMHKYYNDNFTDPIISVLNSLEKEEGHFHMSSG